VILVGTSIPGRELPQPGLPHVDKVMHFLLYAVLGFLLARAMRTPVQRPRPRFGAGALLAAFAAIALFAAADEWHQRWVPGRSTDILDWCADLAGGTLSLMLAALPTPRPERTT
jgi:VanZ family protein